MNSSAATLSPMWEHSTASVTRGLAARTALAGYAAGFSLLPNEWFHLGWLLVAGSLAMGSTRRQHGWAHWSGNTGSWLIAGFLLWMTIRSCCSEAFVSGHAADEIARGLVGTTLLALLCVLLWWVARDRQSLSLVGWTCGMAAGLAALVSLALSYFILPGHMAGERLHNVLVHGGLNPICTGLVFGFAALWLVTLTEQGLSRVPRQLAWSVITLLHFAAFSTGSRGVMLALVLGHGGLLLARGWRRGMAALAVLVITGALYFTSAPLMAGINTWRAEPAGEVSAPGISHHWQKAVERGDNGRIDIYRAGWNALDDPWLGTGQWGMRDVWQCDLQPDPCSMMIHLHSAFYATFIHGGILGAGLLLVLLGHAARCAWRLARRGDAAWVALLAFGCGGLLFDGESLTSLATAPRFEGLLFWVPVVVALARGGLTSPPADS